MPVACGRAPRRTTGARERLVFHRGPRDGYQAYDYHVATCDQPWHMGYIMGVYDPHGMRLNWFASVACGAGSSITVRSAPV